MKERIFAVFIVVSMFLLALLSVQDTGQAKIVRAGAAVTTAPPVTEPPTTEPPTTEAPTTEAPTPVVTEPVRVQPETTSGRPEGNAVESSDNASGGGWEALRQCESGGDYGSTDGQYRGAYQFDYGTWSSVGGSGDPADAPPAEQDARAQRLYNERGAAPWPYCGRYL